jgi:hypothetical protein
VGSSANRMAATRPPGSIVGRVRAATRVVRSEASVHIVREADVRSLRLRQTSKNVDDVLGRHSAEWCKRAAEGVRNDYCEKRCRTAQRVAKFASRASEENGGFCDLGARVQDDEELLCAACEARLRACGASARNLRVWVTGSSVWLDAQPSMEWTRRLARQP